MLLSMDKRQSGMEKAMDKMQKWGRCYYYPLASLVAARFSIVG